MSQFVIPPLPRMYMQQRNGDNAFLAHISREAPRVPWDRFLRDVLTWKNGEHFGLIGPTGLGKTTMMLNLLPLHKYVVAFATKPRDETMDKLIASGYLKQERWQPMDPRQFPRRVLWPDATRLDSRKYQREVFADALDRIYREGHWTVALDELWYLDNVLKLDAEIKTYLLQARSLGISLLAGFQRPAWIPRELYTSATHLMFYRVNDETDIRSLSGIGFRSGNLIAEIVSNLEMHQVLYINTRTGQMARTRCPRNIPATAEGR